MGQRPPEDHHVTEKWGRLCSHQLQRSLQRQAFAIITCHTKVNEGSPALARQRSAARTHLYEGCRRVKPVRTVWTYSKA